MFDWLVGKTEGGAPEATAAPAPSVGSTFKISTKFTPLRLQANKDSKVTLAVSLQNISGAKQMVSVDFDIRGANRAGFDVNSTTKHIENRIGDMAPGAVKEITLPIYGNHTTTGGEIPIMIRAFAHYQTYSKVQSQAKKEVKLRVV